MMEEGAAAAGRTCSRNDWRVIRTVFVAETDAEARKWVREGLHARHWVEANFGVLRSFDWLKFLKHDPDVSTDTIDVDYLLEHLWLVGSPDTVTEKLRQMDEELGGFGSIIVTKYDYGDDPETYRRSLQLLAEEVMPAVNGPGPGPHAG
jgi:alkanesulfonate monooxygenase SsuD/methylene tetrahydromethanopterin reductase-like flavin-dependent oxidoreductase (luciferase family)